MLVSVTGSVVQIHVLRVSFNNKSLLYIPMPIYVILLLVVWNKNKNKFVFDQSELENIFIVFCVGLFHWSLRLVKYPYTKTTLCILPRLIKHSLSLLY